MACWISSVVENGLLNCHDLIPIQPPVAINWWIFLPWLQRSQHISGCFACVS